MSLYTVSCHPLKIMYIYNRARQRFHTERGGGEGKTVVTEAKP